MYYLYGAPHSAYTGKARSYLIKQGIDFEERAFGHPRFMQEILPITGRFFIPQMETPDGTFIQDTSDIIDHFYERRMEKIPSRPTGAVARAVGHLFELFGGEGMLRAGMYYRWFFDELNMTFIEEQFGLFMAPSMPSDQRIEVIRSQTGAMRKAAGYLGVNPETAPAIEASFLEFLDAFNAHLVEHPYIVGGAPTVGDYGMMVMFYAHLARDPSSAPLIKNHAQAVYRWTERMNQPGRCAPEYPDYPETSFSDGEAPDTIKTMMRLIARDYLPEIEASVQMHNDWLAENPQEPGALVGGAKMRRIVGITNFSLNGTDISCGARTYPLYILQRLQDWVDGLSGEEKSAVIALFGETGCLPFINLRCNQRVERQDNKEVWGVKR